MGKKRNKRSWKERRIDGKRIKERKNRKRKK